MTSVTLERDGAVASVVLPGPALSLAVKEGLLSSLREAAADDRVRAVVLTGTGRAFCVGQDLAEHAAALDKDPATALDTVREHYNPIVRAIRSMPKPVLAAVNGVAAGAGAGLAFACDLRVAARGASFLMAFARVGLAADTGASWTLQRLAGIGRAAELLMLAEPVGSATALELGLLTSVVPDADLAAAAGEFAARLAAGPTLAYAAIKESLLYGAAHRLSESLEKEADLQGRLGQSEDHRNATQAFVSKQTPVFQGR